MASIRNTIISCGMSKRLKKDSGSNGSWERRWKATLCIQSGVTGTWDRWFSMFLKQWLLWRHLSDCIVWSLTGTVQSSVNPLMDCTWDAW
jgi:hypothetical protein